MARIKDTSVREVVAAADMVEVVSGADRAAQGRRPLLRALPVPRGADAELLRQPGRQALPLLRLRQGRRRDHVRRARPRTSTSPTPSSGSPSASASRSSTRRPRRSWRSRASGATGSTPCSTRRRRSTSATSGSRRPARPCARYLESRGLGEAVCREFRLGLSPGSGLAAEGAGEGLHAPRSCAAPGLTNARGNDYFPQRLMFPLADARGRIVGFQARKLRDDDPLRGKYVNSPEGELFHKSAILYGLAPGAHGDREAGARASSSRATPT